MAVRAPKNTGKHAIRWRGWFPLPHLPSDNFAQVREQETGNRGMKDDLVWDNREHVLDAVAVSLQCLLKYAGLKARSKFDPPRAATGGFPYNTRTVAELRAFCD